MKLRDWLLLHYFKHSLTAMLSNRATLLVSRMMFPMPVTAMREHTVAKKEEAVMEFRSACIAYICSESAELPQISVAHAFLHV